MQPDAMGATPSRVQSTFQADMKTNRQIKTVKDSGTIFSSGGMSRIYKTNFSPQKIETTLLTTTNKQYSQKRSVSRVESMVDPPSENLTERHNEEQP